MLERRLFYWWTNTPDRYISDLRHSNLVHIPIKLFIGTSIAAELAERIEEQARRVVEAGRLRWSPREQWHVTSLFIGTRDEADVPVIASAIGHVCTRSTPIALHNGRLAAMPADHPSMLWVRFSPSEELSALHHALAHATSTPPSPHQPYLPHITLARGKGAPPMMPDPIVLPSLTLRELTLFRSDPGPNGTIHTPLGTWPLASTNP